MSVNVVVAFDIGGDDMIDRGRSFFFGISRKQGLNCEFLYFKVENKIERYSCWWIALLLSVDSTLINRDRFFLWHVEMGMDISFVLKVKTIEFLLENIDLRNFQ